MANRKKLSNAAFIKILSQALNTNKKLRKEINHVFDSKQPNEEDWLSDMSILTMHSEEEEQLFGNGNKGEKA